MSEERENAYIFEDADELAVFLLRDDGEALKKIKEKIPPISNLCTLKKALSVKPCRCKGKNPKIIMEQRKKRLDSFYERFIGALAENFKDRLHEGDLRIFVKSVILENNSEYGKVAFKLGGETLLEL